MLTGSLDLFAKMEKLAIESKHDESATVVARRPNFPLPPELRDEIYYYLLRHEHAGPCFPAADSLRVQAYTFHVGILAVNKEISEEATKILRSNNFIKVSANWLYLVSQSRMHGIPLVYGATGGSAHFGHACLDIRVSIPESRKDLITTLVVLEPDLPACCDMFQWITMTRKYPSPVVLKNGEIDVRPALIGWPPALEGGYSTEATFSCGKRLGLEARLRMLQSLGQLVIGRQEVRLHGVQGPAVEQLQGKMGPRVVYAVPLAYRILDIVTRMRQVAGELQCSGDTKRALRTFEAACKAWEVLPIFRHSCHTDSLDAAACVGVGAIAIVLSDCLISALYIRLKSNTYMRGNDFPFSEYLNFHEGLKQRAEHLNPRLASLADWLECARMALEWLTRLALAPVLDPPNDWIGNSIAARLHRSRLMGDKYGVVRYMEHDAEVFFKMSPAVSVTNNHSSILISQKRS